MKSCTFSECDRSVLARGWCTAHYNRWRKHGDPAVGGPVRAASWAGVTCSGEGCTKPVHAKGMCPLHLGRANSAATRPVCAVCGEPAARSTRVKDRCAEHLTTELRRRAVAGQLSVRTDDNGYQYVSINRKHMLLHRLVMEDHLGRPLTGDENVHHANGDRSDNRLSNLELWSSSQPAGQRIEDKLAWAREIIALYGDLPDAQLNNHHGAAICPSNDA